jgi:superoxide dismutase, Cu-Zn family
MRRIILPLSLLALAGCSTACGVKTAETVAVSEVALARLARADGSDAGVATLSQRSDGLWMEVTATGLAPGQYGIHLHATGKCDAPDFTTAGPHWNPAAKQHGFENPLGTHAGDLRNLVANAEGIGAFTAKLPGVIADALDSDGMALVIHEKPDDYKSDPSGNSGKRMICGVFARG